MPAAGRAPPAKMLLPTPAPAAGPPIALPPTPMLLLTGALTEATPRAAAMGFNDPGEVMLPADWDASNLRTCEQEILASEIK